MYSISAKSARPLVPRSRRLPQWPIQKAMAPESSSCHHCGFASKAHTKKRQLRRQEEQKYKQRFSIPAVRIQGQLFEEYYRQTDDRQLHSDSNQLSALKKLQGLYNLLQDYSNEPMREYQEHKRKVEALQQQQRREADEASGTESNDYRTKSPTQTATQKTVTPLPVVTLPRPKQPRGLYLWGNVGTGKSMLVDLFYRHVPCRKQRWHIHEFINTIHQRLHRLPRDDSSPDTPVVRLGRLLATEYDVLVLDEFQLLDIADAMIVSQILRELFWHGTVLVTTSNRKPVPEGMLEHSYSLVQRYCLVFELFGNTDYRKMNTAKHWFVRPDPTVVNKMLHHLVGNTEQTIQTLNLSLNRTLDVPSYKHASLSVGRVDFATLCGFQSNMNASDYRILADRYDVLLMEKIPVLNDSNDRNVGHNSARRFVNLIDELYEKQVRLIGIGERTPTSLFEQVPKEPWELPLEESIKELHQAFLRASSRLIQMTSENWWESLRDAGVDVEQSNTNKETEIDASEAEVETNNT